MRVLLIFRERHPLLVASWSNRAVSWLTLTGLLLAIAGFLAAGFLGMRPEGAYIPAHIDQHGRLSAGAFRMRHFE